jgi:hypothetical protein
MLDLILIEWVRKMIIMKLGSNIIEDHLQLNHKGHPLDGAPVCASSLWPLCGNLDHSFFPIILFFAP